MRWFSVLLFLIVSFLCFSCAFSQERPYSISVYGSYTTSSRSYIHPDDPDEILRAQNIQMDHIYGIGIDLRRSLGESNVHLGLNVERISKNHVVTQSIDQTRVVHINDGYVVVPVEVTGYFIIPISSEVLQMYMGGGGGAYFGERRYEEGGVSARVVERSSGFGIHVLSGLQYNFIPSMALRCELKFRDVQFKSVNAFNAPMGFENGATIPLNTQPFDSRINIDGMALTTGLAFRF